MNRSSLLSLVVLAGLGILLASITMLVKAAPQAVVESPGEDGTDLTETTVEAEIVSCAPYYFHESSVNVGVDGDRRIADTTVPTATIPTVVTEKLNLDKEIIRFYSAPVFTDTLNLAGDITGKFWVKGSKAEASFTVEMFDYDPGSGRQALGNYDFTILESPVDTDVDFNITPSTTTIPAGHRLLFVLSGKQDTPGPEVEFFYDGAGRDSRFVACQEKPGSAPSPQMIYLPIVLRNETEPIPTTLLKVESKDTGGIDPVRVLNPDNNSELLRCTIGNDVTQTCGSFPAIGTYKIVANTNNCGLLQGTFTDATPGATVTRTIFCN